MLNSSCSSQSSSLDFNVQTNAETHNEHSSDIGCGLSRMGDNPEVNISPTVYTPPTHSEHVLEVDRGLPRVGDNSSANISPDPCTPVSNFGEISFGRL